jgi:hypothetical protein
MTDQAGPYVSTRDVRAAVRGRETEVLDKLGVSWRDGLPHIRCPYPTHADQNPSWRWDAREARAFCTCTGSDDIVEVIKKVRGVVFADAKLCIAELLGRADLIRDGKRYQPMDAASLLNPPAENRDDGLPINYLAHRLGIAVEAVRIPSTPMVGFKTLAYYDAPTRGSTGKPKLVGEFPWSSLRQ